MQNEAMNNLTFQVQNAVMLPQKILKLVLQYIFFFFRTSLQKLNCKKDRF